MNAAAGPPRGLALWWAGARPRTLGASIVPVAVGTAAATEIRWLYAFAALVVALGLQVGVNYANDFFDGTRGVDNEKRVGPVRLTASGLRSPRAVATAAVVSFAVAGLAGLALAIAVDLRLLIVGALALLAALAYSGGPKPYAGLGLGEVFVFLFFGPIAVMGTTYVQSAAAPVDDWVLLRIAVPYVSMWASVSVGLLAVAILVANNLRDIDTDSAAGKRTLAVRIGRPATIALYRICIVGAFVVVTVGIATKFFDPVASLAFAAIVVAIRPLVEIGRARGPALVGVLIRTASIHICFGILMIASLAIARHTNPVDFYY